MGRKKKELLEVSQESLNYVKMLIKEYPAMKRYCDELETGYGLTLRRCGVDPTLFAAEALPSEAQFREPKDYKIDKRTVAEYMEKREKVYLLEHSITLLHGQNHDVAVGLFLKRKSWKEIMCELNLSRMTVDRARNDAVRKIAWEIDEYMLWKVEKIYC